MALKKIDPTIVPVMVGTAGHVDHGKSALVNLLTGCEMDRHPEAKARGLTIDLGFAPCRLPGNRLVGIIDVPGHEDFIRNMVAGAASIDVLMLVIAADDGVMPQTIEHLKIVRAMRSPKLMVVVTKIDLVDDEMRELVQEDVASFIAEAGYPDAPVILESNITLKGLKDVRKTLQALVESVERESDPRAFRMSVERVFQVKGYGTVVTGIPLSGSIGAGDKVELLPASAMHGVRAIQSYKIDADRAIVNACAALNVRDLNHEDIRRGMVLAAPDTYTASTAAILQITNEHASRVLKRTVSIKFHAGTINLNASLRLLNVEALPPKGTAFAHVRFDEPVALAAGDPCILRLLSPVTTVAAGVVLSAEDYRVRRNAVGFMDRLRLSAEALQQGEVLLAAVLAGPEPVVQRDHALRLSQCTGANAETTLSRLIDKGALIDLGAVLLVAERMPDLTDTVRRRLKRYHKEHPYQWGMSPQHASEEFQVPAASFKKFGKAVGQDKSIIVHHGRLALVDFEPALNGQQMKWQEQILERAAQDPMSPPAKGKLAKELGIPANEMRLMLRLLTEEGVLVVLDPNILLPAMLEDCRRKLLDLFAESSMVTIKEFRDATGIGRNLSVTMLEHFDSEGLTKRVDEGRVLAQPRS